MSRMKWIFVTLMLTASLCLVPLVQAQTVQVTIAGSSAMWQTLALGAYSLACPGGSTAKTCKPKGTTIPAGHWTSNGNLVNLTDTRVSPVNVDAGGTWIVWNAGATKVWSFTKVDSVVGVRCYFAQPACTVSAAAANLAGAGSNKIAANLWGDGSSDSALPPAILALFTGGSLGVTVAATDIRPEDAQFAVCRVNSQLGAGSKGGAASDGTDGLGYNVNNASGVCPVGGLAQANYVGSPIKSGYPASTATANVLSFNIAGNDPVNGTAVPAFTVVEVGATPVVFVTERDKGQLGALTDATPQQLQQAFSGTNCDASAFGLAAGGINIFLREPLSGTMNTTEATLFRHPTVYPGAVLGLSQELNVGANNPLAGQAGTCLAGGGARYRAIGTSEEVTSVQNSAAKFGGTDGIGYTFFSYGNVSSIANNAAYGYITLNNVDPIFASYAGSDPGQPAGAGMLPKSNNLPASCSNTFPCPESSIWTGGYSFPNLRNGTYPAWSIVRLVSTGTPLTNAKKLVTSSQLFVVNDVPDYVPFAATKNSSKAVVDPGLTIVRSHYQQYDGAGTKIGTPAVNSGTKEAGGDMGGQILPLVTLQQVQSGDGFTIRP